MFLFRIILLGLLIHCAGCKWMVLQGQTSNAADVQFLLGLKSELALTDDQFHAIDSLYFTTSEQIVVLDKEIQTISRSGLAENERNDKIRDLNGKKKNLRELRDLSVQLLLTAEQRIIYLEKVKPQKPAVIHMGMNHDRANCNVCVP